MSLKSLMSPLSKRALLYPLSGLILALFLLQVIANKKEVNSTFYDTTYSDIEKKYRKRFNLMDRPEEVSEECTLDYINSKKLEQDHPCVLRLIRLMYLDPPPSRQVPYNLSALMFPDTSYENAADQLRVLKNKKEGFFVECGANDGLLASNTLELEMNHNWTGLLIEASPLNYKNLMIRNRKSWTSNICLSLHRYPTKINFPNPANVSGPAPALFRIIETDKNGEKIYDRETDEQLGFKNMEMKEIQCFPLYSILLALNQTTVDFFALDVEGHEKRVLETIPWAKVNIKTIKSEVSHIPLDQSNKNGSDQLRELLEGEPGYLNFKALPPGDEFYIKNYM